jgi:hypothetical protein
LLKECTWQYCNRRPTTDSCSISCATMRVIFVSIQ